MHRTSIFITIELRLFSTKLPLLFVLFMVDIS